ncbi:MAG: PilZ domain-containing protein [Candidatus Omnitrophica bacterium]|nr:PilZ domain-containing protein [Candidatus Omnitrophota bacterium]
MQKERRKFKRFDAYISARFKSPKTGQLVTTLTHDISRDGIKVTTMEILKVSAPLELELSIPDDPRPIYVTAEVAWARKFRGEDAGCEYGLRFIHIDPVDKFRALDFAYNNWLEEKINDFSDPEEVPELKEI